VPGQDNSFGDNNGFTPAEVQTYLTQHTHSGSIADGKKIKASNINFTVPITQGQGLILRGVDASGNATGNNWKLVVVEVTDEVGNTAGVLRIDRA